MNNLFAVRDALTYIVLFAAVVIVFKTRIDNLILDFDQEFFVSKIGLRGSLEQGKKFTRA